MFNPIKKLPFVRRYSTKSIATGWQNRKIDWVESYTKTWTHPHRALLMQVLRSIGFMSLWEVGCGGGANLVRIIKELGSKQLGGCDVNPDAIQVCKNMLQGGIFEVTTGDDLLMSDKSTDIVLTDMTLIYVGPLKIRKYLREFKRVGRNYVVFVEFHSESWWERLKERLNGHHAHDFKKLLSSEGFYDVVVQKIPQQFYPEATSGLNLRSIITARIP